MSKEDLGSINIQVAIDGEELKDDYYYYHIH